MGPTRFVLLYMLYFALGLHHFHILSSFCFHFFPPSSLSSLSFSLFLFCQCYTGTVWCLISVVLMGETSCPTIIARFETTQPQSATAAFFFVLRVDAYPLRARSSSSQAMLQRLAVSRFITLFSIISSSVFFIVNVRFIIFSTSSPLMLFFLCLVFRSRSCSSVQSISLDPYFVWPLFPFCLRWLRTFISWIMTTTIDRSHHIPRISVECATINRIK